VAASTGTFYGRAMTAGHIYTVAGDGTAGFSGDGGPATGAEMDFPVDVTVGSHGGLLIPTTGGYARWRRRAGARPGRPPVSQREPGQSRVK
jgi:hypothetical protein